MYPQLINQASRLAPMLSRLLARGGTFASPMWKASQIDAPGVNAQPMAPAGQPTGPQVPISTSNYSPPTQTPFAAGSDPMTAGGIPDATMNFGAAGVPMPRARPTMPTQASVPLPQERPADAPQAQEDTPWWQRNAAMMRDPGTGQFIDPAAASAVRGPDLISKMMTYLHNKDIG